MGERLRNLLRQIYCCRTFDVNVNDVYIEVSKADMDEIIIEKIKAKATIRRLKLMNEKLERSIADRQVILDEKAKEISKLENIYGVDISRINEEANIIEAIDISKPNNGYRRFPYMGTRALLTKKYDLGVGFRKYLIKDNDVKGSTPTDDEFQKSDGKLDRNAARTIDFEIDENNNIVYLSNRGDVRDHGIEPSVEMNKVSVSEDINNNKSTETVIKSDYEINQDDDDNSFWFFKSK